MKKWIIVVLLIFAVAGFFYVKNNTPGILTNQRPNPSPSPLTIPGTQIMHNGQTYVVFLQKINAASLTLIPNFSEKLTSTQIMETHGCTYGSNAGFYTAESEPLGYFYIKGSMSNLTVHSKSLINGFVAKTDSGQVTITSELPESQSAEFIFQSGPLFSPDSTLRITQDEEDRRIALGIDEENAAYLLAFVKPDNFNSGPRLTDLPILTQKLPVSFVQLINLDGGAASAFHSKETRLGELTYVGSFLCGK